MVFYYTMPIFNEEKFFRVGFLCQIRLKAYGRMMIFFTFVL